MAFVCTLSLLVSLVLACVGGLEQADSEEPKFSPECPPLPCPLPPPECQIVHTFYWNQQKSGDMVMCPGCDNCANHDHDLQTRSNRDGDDTTGETPTGDTEFSPACPPLPCPPPYPGCKETVPTFYWNKQQSGDSVMCPGCDMCLTPGPHS